MNPKVRPENLPLFQRASGAGVITEAEYQQLERDFIAAQGSPGSPVFLWGWGHQQLLRHALGAAGVRVRHPDPAVLHPFVLVRKGFSRLRELESKIVEEGRQD